MQDISEWEWFGRAGHFICADRCQFHMHTHVNGYCISTIGEMYSGYIPTGEPEPVGYKRLYETMVFRLNKRGDDLASGSEIDMKAYNEEAAAAAGHMAMCKKYTAMEAGNQ